MSLYKFFILSGLVAFSFVGSNAFPQESNSKSANELKSFILDSSQSTASRYAALYNLKNAFPVKFLDLVADKNKDDWLQNQMYVSFIEAGIKAWIDPKIADDFDKQGFIEAIDLRLLKKPNDLTPNDAYKLKVFREAVSLSLEKPIPHPGSIIQLFIPKDFNKNFFVGNGDLCFINWSGMCGGISEATAAILTSIDFEPGDIDPPELIKSQIIKASRGQRAALHGYNGYSEFLVAMNMDWKNNENPLKRAIIELQKEVLNPAVGGAQDELRRRGYEAIRAFDTKGKANKMIAEFAIGSKKLQHEMFPFLKEKLENSGPFVISLGYRHAVTLVGYEINDGNVTGLLAMDSNYPGRWGLLEYTEDERWFYRMPPLLLKINSGQIISNIQWSEYLDTLIGEIPSDASKRKTVPSTEIKSSFDSKGHKRTSFMEQKTPPHTCVQSNDLQNIQTILSKSHI